MVDYENHEASGADIPPEMQSGSCGKHGETWHEVTMQSTIGSCSFVRLTSRWMTENDGERSTWTVVASFSMIDSRLHRLVCLAVSQVAGLLVGVNMPDHVVGQSNDLIPGALGHLGESLGLGLVLEGVCGEVDTCNSQTLDIGLQQTRDIPVRCTSALTRMLTPPIPSNSTSSSLFFLQSPILTRYVRPVSYSL